MTQQEDLQRLNTLLDTREGDVRTWEARYSGNVPLAFIPPATRKKLGDRLQSLSINFAGLAVDALSERLRLQGFTVDGKADLDLWETFQRTMDAGAGQVHLDALALGSSYVSVWADNGLPVALPEHPAQVVVTTNPVTRQVDSALKRWAADGKAYAVLYKRDKITAFVSDSYVPQDTTTPHAWSIGAIPSTGWTSTGSVPNPLGQVPIVPFVNSGRLTQPYGVSEMAGIADLNDALTKILVDMLVTSESSAQPRRWATGIEVEVDDDGNAYDPWEGRTTTAQSESPEAKFGQFAPSDLSAYRNAAELLVRQIGALSGLPPQMLGLHADAAMSADAIRAAEASLTAKAEQRQRLFGRSWSEVARLMVAIRDGKDPKTIAVQPIWGDPASRSVAQVADSAVKLFASNLLSRRAALADLGKSPDEIAAIERDAAREAALAQMVAE
ncbi:SPP1 Gp6-like portal protein [Dermacoccus sp. SAI-028]|uniref:phage portal protein n=1 Tax=Dermacoccus sp. SAI-028 TaxID=2768432 RepID=UPI00104D0C2C|nr:phage portal protein [Dermacoccus sp. SAI-028]TCJ91616.1 SPP1 Gp6-like portal protein [Dermacoccus sp. SAI-028]